MKIHKKWPHVFLYIPLFFIGIITLYMVILPIISGVFFFTFDQARDALWVKNQIDFKQPSLIGPWGSLTGIFFGPLWFWLLSIPYLSSGGNPVAFTLFNTLMIYTTLIVAAYLIKKNNPLNAYFFLLLGFLSLQVQTIASTAFSQHMLPLFTFLLIFSLIRLLETAKSYYMYFAVLSVSLMFHAEPPLFLFSLPTLGIVTYLANKKHSFFTKKMLLYSCIYFIIPFLPSIFFDVRHDFIQLKALFSYLRGENQSLGDILPFWQRIIDRPMKFFTIFQLTIINQPIFAFSMFLVTLFVFIRKKLNGFLKTVWQVNSIYLISLLLIFIIYPPELKSFYLDGVIILYLFLVGATLTYLWQNDLTRKIFIILFLLVTFWINKQPFQFLQSQKNNFSDYLKDTSIFRTQVSIVDWIYQDANGKGFKVYTYQPAVYDYPYQYLFFWYGVRRYGYLPEEFSYLPDKPEYVQKKSKQLIRLKERIKPSEQFFYLIIEPGKYKNKMHDWQTNFPIEKYPLIKKTQFPDQTLIEKRLLIIN